MAEAFTAYPFVEFLLGRGVDQELLDRGIALEGHMEGEFKSHVLRASFTVAQLLKFTDRLDEARRTFTELLGDAAVHGAESPIPQIRYHLAELECRAGNWDAAMEQARESRAAAQRIRMGAMSSEGHFAVGLVEAHLGRADPARLEALEGLRVAEAAGEILLLIPNLAVLGFLELSLGRPAEADAYLSRAVELERAMGVREPAYFRIVPDEVEALVALGRLDEAEALLAPFEEAGRNLDRAWAIATGARCRALVFAARGDLAGASAAADEAVREHDRLPLPFELGRTLLVRGAVERRAKRKREARDTLTKALEVFDGLGAALWADKTRAELARIGGRAASSLDLTPTEDRVAALVAAGGTNREVADALFVSVHTVEANLKRIYRKLGIRSRTELASRFPPPPPGPEPSCTGHRLDRYGFRGFLGSVLPQPRDRRKHPSEGGIMSTKAGTMGFSGRPALFTFWTVAVSALAAAALILSAVALNVAGRDDRSVTSVKAADPEHRSAAVGRGQARSHGGPRAGRVRPGQGPRSLWDAGKLEAMAGRVLGRVRPRQDSRRCGTRASSRPWPAACWPSPSGPRIRAAVGRSQARGHGGPRARRVAPSARSCALRVIREAGGPHPGPPASPASSLGRVVVPRGITGRWPSITVNLSDLRAVIHVKVLVALLVGERSSGTSRRAISRGRRCRGPRSEHRRTRSRRRARCRPD